MVEGNTERRITAILSADVVGYSRLMGRDEAATLAALKAHRAELFEPKTAQYHGRTVKLMGDGALMEFASVVDAVKFAVEVQCAMVKRNAEVSEDRRIIFRMGINVGDIIVEGDDIHGDGVNIAARLESLAEPGGICIRRNVRNQVRDKLDLAFEDQGEIEVKNIARPMRVFRVVLDEKAEALVTPVVHEVTKPVNRRWMVAAAVVLVAAVGGMLWWQPWASAFEPASMERMTYPLPDKPSIAVLPFINLSDDPSQEYFADGMTEDLITDLSKRSGLFVIARNSVFVYKGKNVDVLKVGRELGVQFVLEGSVRRVGDRVRINAQLIDARSNTHLWADRYDGDLDDIFALQDQVSKRIIDELAVQLSPGEEALPTRKETKSARAHDAFLQGWAYYLRATPEHYVLAVPFFEEAVRLDPDYGRAYAALASIYGNAREKGWQTRLGLTPDDTLEKALEYLERAKAHPTPLGHQVASGFLSYAGRHDEAIAEAESAIALNANNPAGYFAKAKALTYAGRPAEAAEAIGKAMRLNPHYPPDYLFHLGMSRFGMERFDKAAEPLEEARKRVPDHRGTLTFLVATYGYLGRAKEAATALEKLKQIAVNAVVDWRSSATVLQANIWPFAEPADLERLRRGLRLGGMPEFRDEWGLRRDDKLTGDEIRKLAFGHTLQGRHPVSSLEFTITRTADGQFTSEGLWLDTGVSRIVGYRLCNEWTKYGPSCAVIYRNPGGTPEKHNDYLLVQRSGAFPFSVTE